MSEEARRTRRGRPSLALFAPVLASLLLTVVHAPGASAAEVPDRDSGKSIKVAILIDRATEPVGDVIDHVVAPKPGVDPFGLTDPIGLSDNNDEHSPGNASGFTKHPSGRNSIRACPSGGVCDDVEVSFKSTVAGSCGFWTCEEDVSGESHGYWWGSSPWNADDMSLGDRWTQHGCAVTASWPPSMSGSSDSVWWDTQFGAPTWQMHHKFNGIHFSTWCGFGEFVESATATARFGTQYYSTTATW